MLSSFFDDQKEQHLFFGSADLNISVHPTQTADFVFTAKAVSVSPAPTSLLPHHKISPENEEELKYG